MTEWSLNNLAHIAVHQTLIAAAQFTTNRANNNFRVAAGVSVKALRFWGNDATSKKLRKDRAMNLALIMDESFMLEGYEARYEKEPQPGQDEDDLADQAITAMQKLLLDDTKKVSDLGGVVDEHYLFKSEYQGA